MHIDTISRKETVQHDIFTGKRYCFAYGSGDGATVGDPFGYENHYWFGGDIFSVLWTEEEFKAFRPKDKVHAFKNRLMNEMQEELDHLKKKVKRAPTNYQGQVSHIVRNGQYPSGVKVYSKPGFNVKQHIQNRINFIEVHRVDFVEITFVKEKGMSGFY